MAKEIELRARVTAEQAASLRRELSDKCRVQRRCFIDYSTFLEGIGERKLDVRVRVTNDSPEIIVKRGKFGASVREESSVHLSSDQLRDALDLMALLGYEKGVAGGRRIFRGEVNKVEIALQEVLDFKDATVVGEQFVEVEFLGNSDDTESAEALLRQFLMERGLSPFTMPDWNEYVRSLNERWNGVYQHGVTSVDVIRALGS